RCSGFLSTSGRRAHTPTDRSPAPVRWYLHRRSPASLRGRGQPLPQLCFDLSRLQCKLDFHLAAPFFVDETHLESPEKCGAIDSVQATNSTPPAHILGKVSCPLARR